MNGRMRSVVQIAVPVALLAHGAWAGALLSRTVMMVLAPPRAMADEAANAADEKAKAQANPYANDLGPDTLPPELLATYPAAIQEGYRLLLVKCSACHQASRPLNSEFVDAETWKRYVKRMMGKGCGLTPGEAKSIWNFLVHDSKVRKTGDQEAAWAAHRVRLLAEFKQKYPARYEDLYGRHLQTKGGG